MAISLYYFESAPPARSVLMVIAALKLKVDLIRINLSNKEQFAEEFLQRNPTHTVPTLDDNGFIVWDSHAIVQYLVDKYGRTDELYPKSFEERTRVNQMLFFETSILFPSLARAVRPVFYDNATAVPDNKIKNIEASFEFLETFLSVTNYLASNHLTIADICALSTVSTIQIFHQVNNVKYPKLVAWLSKLKSLEFYNVNLDGIQMFTDMFMPLLNSPIHLVSFIPIIFSIIERPKKLSYTMSVKLHYIEASPAARSVMMVMKVLQFPVEYMELDLSTKDQFAQIFLQLNPAHTVPILDDDGFILWESHAIVKYLVDKFGKTDQLYPKALQERAKVDQMLFYNASVLFPLLRDAVIPIFNAKAPLQSSSVPEDQKRNIDSCLEELEQFLRTSDFLAVNRLTIADICALSILSTINYFKEFSSCNYPKLNKWLNRLRSEHFYRIELDGLRKFSDIACNRASQALILGYVLLAIGTIAALLLDTVATRLKSAMDETLESSAFNWIIRMFSHIFVSDSGMITTLVCVVIHPLLATIGKPHIVVTFSELTISLFFMPKIIAMLFVQDSIPKRVELQKDTEVWPDPPRNWLRQLAGLEDWKRNFLHSVLLDLLSADPEVVLVMPKLPAAQH
ncbi:hypothetical protein HUJ04_000686 [Dendroctonus ponderosae]|nr:hypothetical protein HUJ04_000686 [Dendroctonus ponderosae]